MRLHQQFDLNQNELNPGRFSPIQKKISEAHVLVEKLVNDLLEEGYIIIESSARYMGVPQSITVVKEFTGPFASRFSAKVQHDFNAITKSLGIEKMFE